jgi:di/tricarboxylate transporter
MLLVTWQTIVASWQLVLVLGLTGLAALLFVLERFRVDIVALLVLAVLLVSGIVTPKEGLSGFSNEATVTIAAMFVLSAGLRRTGAVNAIGGHVSELLQRNYWMGMVTMMFGVGVMSAFINNTAVVAVLIPMMMQAARDADISTSKILMPLSFAAMFGGVCTLIGTSTNLVVSSVLEQNGMRPIGMFEMAPLGLIFFATGLIYMLTVGDWLLPGKERRSTNDLVESFELSEYVTDLEVGRHSDLAGKPVEETWLTDQDDLHILEIFRDRQPMGHPNPAWVLEPRDVVRIRGTARSIRDAEDHPGLGIRPFSDMERFEQRGEDIELVEAVIAPNAALDGSTLRETEFFRDASADVVALRRQKAKVLPSSDRKEVVHTELRDETLQAGDVLLVQSEPETVRAMQNHPAFILVTELGLPSFRTDKTIPAIATVLGVVLAAALDLCHISVAAIAGCVALLLFDILSIEEAYEEIEWEVVFLLAGLLPLGLALQKTGGIAIISGFLTDSMAEWGPRAVLSGLYMTTALLTSFMSNQATAILFTPVAISAAQSPALDIDPRPLVLAVAFAASASFITPIGYQTNTMIYGAGQYRFSDFIRVGTALTLLFWGLGTLFIPMIWPF